MKLRAQTQTVAANRGGGSYMASNLIIPFGGSIEIEGSDIIVRTFNCETRVTLENYVVFRYYKWWAIFNYRIIIEHDEGYRAVDFRGRRDFSRPDFFTSLGFDVTSVNRFWRRSYDVEDGEQYKLDFSPS